MAKELIGFAQNLRQVYDHIDNTRLSAGDSLIIEAKGAYDSESDVSRLRYKIFHVKKSTKGGWKPWYKKRY